MKSRKFVDSVVLYASAGDGGNGCTSFRREKYIAKGGPDGGDGGNGGHVILRGDRETDSLIRIYFQPHQRAERGVHGKGKTLFGKNGGDLVIPVPCGTEIWNPATGTLLGDLLAHGQEIIVARGGRGGWGNCHWKTATHQAPTEHTDGEKGEEVTLRLELKLIADAGLVGFPNAGKSSLLRAISDAHPKVAAYPFTTLNPVIGTLRIGDFDRLTIADLPGLIAGASEGVGLGDAFLRHVERAPLLIFVIDMAGTDMRRPFQDYRDLKAELKAYRADLADRPAILVANKMDVPEAAENLKEFRRKTRTRPLPVSALTGMGVQELKDRIASLRPSRQTGGPSEGAAEGKPSV